MAAAVPPSDAPSKALAAVLEIGTSIQLARRFLSTEKNRDIECQDNKIKNRNDPRHSCESHNPAPCRSVHCTLLPRDAIETVLSRNTRSTASVPPLAECRAVPPMVIEGLLSWDKSLPARIEKEGAEGHDPSMIFVTDNPTRWWSDHAQALRSKLSGSI